VRSETSPHAAVLLVAASVALALAGTACEDAHITHPDVAQAEALARAGVTARQPTDERSEMRARVEDLLTSAEARIDRVHMRKPSAPEPTRSQLDALERRFATLRASLQSEVDALGAADDASWPELHLHIRQDMHDLEAALERAEELP
jgi:hypothetical protein